MIGRVACLFGRHRWDHFHNPEVGGATPYLVCRRCGKDKPQYDSPTEGQATGMGGVSGG